MSIPTTAPAMSPKPTTDATTCRGNLSDAVVKMFAGQPWWVAAAKPASHTPVHRCAVLETSSNPQMTER